MGYSADSDKVRSMVRVWAFLLLLPCAFMSFMAIGAGTEGPGYSRQQRQVEAQASRHTGVLAEMNRATAEYAQHLALRAKLLLLMGVMLAVVCIECVGVIWKATAGWASALGGTAIIVLGYCVYLFGVQFRNPIATIVAAVVLGATAVVMFGETRRLASSSAT